MLANQVGLSNKVVSERHHYASQEKNTAGETAKILSKELKVKISAKDVVAAYHALGRRAEWHHSGFYKGTNGSTMGRTFFFDDEDIEFLIANWAKANEIKAAEDAEIERKTQITVKGFYYDWDYDYSGRYGKKTNHKVLHVYEGSELGTPRNFTACSAEILNAAKLNLGKKYYGWDEPSEADFKPLTDEQYQVTLLQKEAERLLKLEAEKTRQMQLQAQLEQNRHRNQAEKTAKAMKPLSAFTPIKDEINIIKKWTNENFPHPCPAEILDYKNKSGLNWRQFEAECKNVWSVLLKNEKKNRKN